MKQPMVSEQDGWNLAARRSAQVAVDVVRWQRTMGIAKVEPTWLNFLQTRVGRNAVVNLRSDMLQKFQAWWELARFCAAPGDWSFRQERTREDFKYACTFLHCEVVLRRHGGALAMDWRAFGMGADRAGAIREAVLASYDRLTLGS